MRPCDDPHVAGDTRGKLRKDALMIVRDAYQRVFRIVDGALCHNIANLVSVALF